LKYGDFVFCLNFDHIMAIEDLEKALDLSTFKFLTSFWLFLANKNKASKDIYNVNLHQLCEKPQN